MRLVATVLRVIAPTEGRSDTAWPSATTVEIVDAAGGAFYLFRYAAGRAFVGDTWHQTLVEAKEQAQFEFELSPEGWKDADA